MLRARVLYEYAQAHPLNVELLRLHCNEKSEDKRSPDFNGDREVMEYQGLDPDARGPFVFSSSGMIRPA